MARLYASDRVHTDTEWVVDYGGLWLSPVVAVPQTSIHCFSQSLSDLHLLLRNQRFQKRKEKNSNGRKFRGEVYSTGKCNNDSPRQFAALFGNIWWRHLANSLCLKRRVTLSLFARRRHQRPRKTKIGSRVAHVHRCITNRCLISANMGSIFTQTGKGKSY